MSQQWTRRRLLGSAAAAGAAASTSLVTPRFGVRPASAATSLTWAINAISGSEIEMVQNVVDGYKAGHPDVDVSVLSYDPETYDQKLLADIAAGTLPDIFVSADVFTKPFFDAGLTADMTQFAAKTGFKLDDFDPKFLDLATYDGQVGFLPRAADVVVTYYNKRLFDESGVPYPAEDWTYGDMLAAAEKLTKKASDGTVTQYGVTAGYEWWAYWVPMVIAEGGAILSDDNTKAVFDSPEGTRAWNIIFDGLKNGWFAPTSVQQTMGGEYGPFMNGKAAMTFTVRALTPSFRAQLKDDWDVQLVPRGSVERKTGMGTMGYAMSAQSKDPDTTWDLLQYTYTEGMKVFMGSYLVVPPIESFYDDPAWLGLPGPPYNNAIFVTATETAMLPPKLPFYSTGPFNQAMKDGIQAVVSGQMAPEAAVARMAQEATAALQRG